MHGKEILYITTTQGLKAPNDEKILVEGKPLSIRDLLKMVRLMADNERRINRDKIARNNNFFFGKAIWRAVYTADDIDDILKETLVPDKRQSLIIDKELGRLL